MKENHIKFHKFDTINNDNVLRLLTIGGVDQVPFLYNEETEDKIYESEEIIKYLENCFIYLVNFITYIQM